MKTACVTMGIGCLLARRITLLMVAAGGFAAGSDTADWAKMSDEILNTCQKRPGGASTHFFLALGHRKAKACLTRSSG